MFVDTHLHLIDRSRLYYPWLAGEPALNRDFPYAEYAADALRAGISDVLHMEVDVAPEAIGDETEFVSGVAGRPGSLVRGAISSCRPESGEFAAFLETALQNRFIKGFRRILHVMPDAVSEATIFRDNVRRLSSAGLTFDLCLLPHQLPLGTALADHCPDVQFVLDHCGVPDIRRNSEHPWREHMAEIARRPNVMVKISGVVAYTDPGSWTAETLRPYVEHAVGVFGWDRVVWGSDWPVCTKGGGLLAWVAATHALTMGCSLDERENLFWRNAARVWDISAAKT